MRLSYRLLGPIAVLIGIVAAPARADESVPSDTYIKHNDETSPDKPSSPGSAPVLRLTGPDWNDAARAEGVKPRADLAGDPNASLPGKPKLAAADQDSFFNTQEWQNIMTPKGGHGHASALKQLAGAGEGLSLNAALDAVDKAVEGH
ncbi:MAG TPA: hypothetical protein VKS60_14410 [Stellaceae bacterium]|nr:hypothetical protein [Stellaceae bacterium]